MGVKIWYWVIKWWLEKKTPFLTGRVKAAKVQDSLVIILTSDIFKRIQSAQIVSRRQYKELADENITSDFLPEHT